MKPMISEQALNALREFDLPSAPNGCMPYGNGHIHTTFVASCPMKDRTEKRYILQAVNTDVFHNPDPPLPPTPAFLR